MATYCNTTTSNDDEGCIYALKLQAAFTVPMTLKAVIELGIIDKLLAADGSAMTAEELVAGLPCPVKGKAVAMVDRMLRFLASHSVVHCATEFGPDGIASRSYTAAPVCKWLAGEGMQSMVPFGRMILNKNFLESWYYIKDAVLDGGSPFEKAHGLPMFEYISANDSLNKLFNHAMSSHSLIITKKFIDSYQGFEGTSVLVDVGGGIGTTMQMIKFEHKNLGCINYDLPHVIAKAAPIEGVEHVGGSMFDNIPHGNAVLLKWVLHNWGEKECITILKNCYTALPENGKLIILEYILPPTPEPAVAAQGAFELDLAMLVWCGDGKERTEQEITKLTMDAGFSGDHNATYIFANVWALEFTK